MARCRHYETMAPPQSPPSVNGGGGAPSPICYAHEDLIVDSDGGGRPTKRPRADDDVRDHISALPDDVLIGIISRLPIHDAVATGGVSPRWSHLWKHVPRISLRPHHIRLRGYDDDERGDAAGSLVWAERLAGAASSVLRHHRGAGVDKFLLALPLPAPLHAAVLDQAVEFAAAAGTRELHLSLTNSHRADQPAYYDFPHRRFASGRLQRLHLHGVNLAAAAQVHHQGLAQLTHLSLTRVAVDDAGVAGIVSACAALTVLELKDCRQLVHATVSHERLRVLGVHGCGSLKSIAVESSTLLELVYKGHRVGISYRRTPTVVRLVLRTADACPLGCLPSGAAIAAALPKLKQLFLEFPSPPHAAACTQLIGWRFEGLNQMVLLLKTPWREHVASVASLLVAAPLVRELRVEAYSDLPAVLPPDNNKQTAIRWPEGCSPEKLRSIVIGGFSGEPELMELVFFLLQRSPSIRTVTIDTHRRHLSYGRGWRREEAEDTVRCYYARGVVWTHLAPKIPRLVSSLPSHDMSESYKHIQSICSTIVMC